MICFFCKNFQFVYALQCVKPLLNLDLVKLSWLFGEDFKLIKNQEIKHSYVGPRKEMISPWSTNAVEILRNMKIQGVERMEKFISYDNNTRVDWMLFQKYNELNQTMFSTQKTPESVFCVENIGEYNTLEGLALSDNEIEYLETISINKGRKLTDSEVFGFSQVNSEHCRHKIFNGKFIIEDKVMPYSLFEMIKKTTKKNPNDVVSAYKDNVAFIKGPTIKHFLPTLKLASWIFREKEIDSVLSLKSETHNFPTTVEPFNGAATGSGGEIRDRLAGGRGSLPLFGTSAYMTSYTRLDQDQNGWEKKIPARDWLYHSPKDILIKASDGASDFGNKFGQPMLLGSVLTFEYIDKKNVLGYDKSVMLAGGVGYTDANCSHKQKPQKGDFVILLGGDNYRIGMGGSSVSSVVTGELNDDIELNAVQRSNPEMQKRVMNTIRAVIESEENVIVSVHDLGAGGNLNCLSELVEETGGLFQINQFPLGDKTLSDKEIIGNESQERIGIVVKKEHYLRVKNIANRERCPINIVGEVTDDLVIKFQNQQSGIYPIELELSELFGGSSLIESKDQITDRKFERIPNDFSNNDFQKHLTNVLKLEAVACKDWLTNKVDRSVTGRVATQQTCGEIQLPLNNVAVTTLSFTEYNGIASSMGHSPISALIDPTAGSVLGIVEALTNLIWSPLTNGLRGVSLSANWMWPANNVGENARLYSAVEAVSKYAQELGINIPTGKDSLSMVQKYPDKTKVYAPGTVIISSIAQVSDVRKTINTNLMDRVGSSVVYIDITKGTFQLGGTSFAQTLNLVGDSCAEVPEANYFKKVFDSVQTLINKGYVLSGHDISSGGLITSLLEMNFSNKHRGLSINLDEFVQSNLYNILFSEQPGVLIQVDDYDHVYDTLSERGIAFFKIGSVISDRKINISKGQFSISLDIDVYRDEWFDTSYKLDSHQRTEYFANQRRKNYPNQVLKYKFPLSFDTFLNHFEETKSRNNVRVKAAIIRETGVNGDRELAWALFMSGFEVIDIHMTDLISGKTDLSDVHMIGFAGGFSNSDVLGSAKGWAGTFLYNEKAKTSLEEFYQRDDTMSIGVCNGCQLMMELKLIFPKAKYHPKMNKNDSQKFESSFVNLDIEKNNSIMLESLAGSRLGVWIAHGEGKFIFREEEKNNNVVAKYSYSQYPANPNGSHLDAAAICSDDGRHLAIMPHIERSLYPYNWAYYPNKRKSDKISPWGEAFFNAYRWINKKIKNQQR